jgi:hypothetical protein
MEYYVLTNDSRFTCEIVWREAKNKSKIVTDVFIKYMRIIYSFDRYAMSD